LNGKPVFIHSLLVLQKCPYINQIIITADKKYFDFIHSYSIKYKITKLTHLVEGGKTRFQSVKNAFEQIDTGNNELILIHDAARPNINTDFVNKILSFALTKGNTVIGVKISDTVKKEKKGLIDKTLNREELWTVQTPQIFKFGDLKKAYTKSSSEKNYTDESSLVEDAGFKVNLFEGPKNNVKLTTIDDFVLLKKILK
jgi:2-C-methyl-D-erythritol 4-phosphate cytidylyltransferase